MHIDMAEPKRSLSDRLKRKKNGLTGEDVFVLTTLEQLKGDLAHVHHSLDTVTDPMLIDGYIYEMNAIHMKYQFYMKLCKARGLVAEPLVRG